MGVGFGDAVTREAVEESFSTVLGLFPAPRIKIYPKETVVAEKFEAMMKLGRANSRMKDFWDVNYPINIFDFDGALLQRAIRATFGNRQTQFPENLPIVLNDAFARDILVKCFFSSLLDRFK